MKEKRYGVVKVEYEYGGDVERVKEGNLMNENEKEEEEKKWKERERMR